MDDEIIYSWCFNDVECFDSTPSAAIIILDKALESFSSLRSLHMAHEKELGISKRVHGQMGGEHRVSIEGIKTIGIDSNSNDYTFLNDV